MMRPAIVGFAGSALALVALVVGCGRPPSAPGGSTDQVAEGAPLYLAHCAKCHGPTGGGSPEAPAVVGKSALPLDPPPGAKVRKTQFHTAKDVLDFISAHMPGDAPGSLSATQYANILAFDLKANGVDLHGMRVNGTTAAGITIHPNP